MPLNPPYRVVWDVPFTDAAWQHCKEYLGANLVDAPCLYDVSAATRAEIWKKAARFDLYVNLWALFLPSARRELITEVKDEPYLHSLLLYDEPELPYQDPAGQMICYNEIKSYAPNVPLMTIQSAGYVWCVDAFDILGFNIYPCSPTVTSDPMAYLHAKVVTLGNAAKIQQAIALGKEFIPFLQAFGGDLWCAGCAVINSGVFPEYNGMEGITALYLKWKEMAGGHADGACAYHYPDFVKPGCGVDVMQPQIRNLFHTLLGAPPPPPPPPPPVEDITCPECASVLRVKYK